MNEFTRKSSAVFAVGACMLLGAAASPAIFQGPQPLFPCNRDCPANVSLTPANGLCTTPGTFPNCGSIGVRVTIQATGGQCTPVGGGCAFNCTYLVTIDYGSGGSCNNTTVTGTDCGGSYLFPNLVNCGGPCFLQTHTDTVACGSSCNLSYTVSDTASSETCTVGGTLTCGNHTCP